MFKNELKKLLDSLPEDYDIPTPGNPRIVSRERLYHYIRRRPNSQATARKLIEMGFWVIPEDLSRWDQTFPDPLTEDLTEAPRTFTRDYLDELMEDDPKFKDLADKMIEEGLWVVKEDSQSKDKVEPEKSND